MLLAIRTILVTTRAAVRHAPADGGEDARSAARHGLRLLDGLAARLAERPEPAIGEAFRTARRELVELASSPESLPATDPR